MLDLDSLVFPRGSHQSGHNMPTVESFEFLSIQDSAGILSLTIKDESMGNHPHHDVRQGYWWWNGDSLHWIGSTWRNIYTVSGARSARTFLADPVVHSQMSGTVRLDYSRRWGAQEELWSGDLYDLYPTVLGVDSMSIHTIGLKINADSILPLRNSLPMLVAERRFVDPKDISCPTDIAVVPLFAQSGFGEPLLSPYSVTGRMSYSLREALKGPIAPTVNGWIEGDSLALSFCMPDERKVAFWFDPDLRQEYGDSIISGEELVYVVHPHERSSPFRVEGFRAYHGSNGLAFELVDSGEGRFRWSNTGLEVTIRIARSRIGFQTIDSLAVCGFGMQSLWWEGDTPGEFSNDFEHGPDGFNRDKPSTWGNLVLGKREDHIDERGLLQRLKRLEENQEK